MMADVLCNNAFLKETPLTSTKNKFILEPESRNLFCDEFAINSIFNMKSGTAVPSRKRKLHSSYFESLTKENALTSTVNKFLPKPPLLEKKGVCSKKKKKKKLAYRSARYRHVLAESRSRSRSRSWEISECDAAPVSFSADAVTLDCAMERSADTLSTKFLRSSARKSAPAAGSPAYSLASPEYISYRDTDFPESERIIPEEISECISAPFGAFDGNMNDSFLFGAASVRQAPMNLRKRSGARPQVFGAPPPGFGAIPKMFNSAMIRPPTLVPDLFNMPAYNFASAEEFKAETFESFSFVDAQASLLQLERARCVKSKKMQFLNITSMALIYNSNLKNAEDVYRVTIQKYADEVKTFDPEFILKVALFSRQELHIRSASNFLLSYAAYHEETRPYLEKYFESCIRLPSDWMEVADLYQVFSDSRLKNRSLPSALKKVMAKSFSKFDEYQLAKYNREKKASETKGFTLKQLIRLLHLDSPANEIMCLIGKKYPETAEAFRKSKLPGIWDSRRAGQRMKLPVPETWETQISAHGNKPEIWEQLIDHSKLPYMAMLRNLRNVILSGISQKHHEKVLKHLKSKGAVINSRQTPLQFFEAFKILEDVKDAYYLRHAYRDSRIGEPQWKKARRNKITDRANDISIALVSDYEEAVSEALEISALHNLQPIPGKSLVICDILFPSSLENSKKNKIYNLCIMMGLMCLKACEDCKMNVICGDYSDEVELSEYSFCQSIKNACAQYKNENENATSHNSGKATKSVLEYYLKQHVILREKISAMSKFQIFIINELYHNAVVSAIKIYSPRRNRATITKLGRNVVWKRYAND
ncbi:Telomerase protein component 1 [Araneus ventricosus]|uniref:Telomerase protein component 1 n=1 Tax=Araneus ventricosus TaxID=182803 RepID=A0A4Y2AHI6_ARAVE|nr:Telomerase protein component 1 [Araneus ventricosus]